ncbi:2-oxoglutarate and iron-dependent oxygenase domain-containing protein [Galbitalea sp. SE-J8]|uniref:isopenicillin N synthase family dioxygenase n=1 Tax=Galbitalea sp. SE-J8 TaxID=3054952 RepID=UPI00259CC18D|nr:2-oxoglutarate and iron-dependent oxygenase domain-containing protein [Galbitalea sp. SE-J8]MDM4763844.1 2-oxoglutarate and iron-dependent oxygenase domain-containing protein [Galbitalea sp. SE-J8]
MALDALPILDLSDLDRGEESAAAFRARLREVTHDVGFFYLVGHGIPQQLMAELIATSKRFFALPEAEKLSIENVHSPQFRGYTRKGAELTNGETDWREQIDFSTDRPEVPRGEDVADYWRLEGPNLWPAALPELKDVADRWRDALTVVADRLMRTWALALGQPEDVFADAFRDPYLLSKIVRYPGVTEPGADPAQGVGAHRDGGVLTLLYVEPGKGGLQVEHEGEWVDAPAVDGAFVVNVGEMFELATDGYLKATLHRVISPVVGDERISVPYFYSPRLDARIPHLELPAELAAQSRGVSADPTESPILEVFGENVLRYRLRAHPNVVEVQHPDLLARQA